MSQPYLYCRINRELDTWPSDYYLLSVTALARQAGLSRRAARRRIQHYVDAGYLARWDEAGRAAWAKLAPHTCHPQCMICGLGQLSTSGPLSDLSGFVTIAPHIPPDAAENV